MTRAEQAAEREQMERCILGLYDKGLTAMEIVDQTKQCKTKVYDILKRNNRQVKLLYITNDAEIERELNTHKGANARMDRNAKRVRPGMKIEYIENGSKHKGTVASCFPYYVSVIGEDGRRHSPMYQDII